MRIVPGCGQRNSVFGGSGDRRVLRRGHRLEGSKPDSCAVPPEDGPRPGTVRCFRCRRSVVDGFAGDLVVGVVDGFLDEPDEVAVMQGVDHVPAVLAGIDQSAEPKFG